MRVEKSKLGDVEFEESRVITLGEGLLGFSDAHRYALLDTRDRSTFRWMLSIDRPELAVVVADPFSFFPGYRASLTDADLEEIGFREGDELAVLSIVTVRGRRRDDISLNLRAPVVVNHRTLIGKQVVLKEESWGIRVALPPTTPSPSCATGPATAVSTCNGRAVSRPLP